MRVEPEKKNMVFEKCSKYSARVKTPSQTKSEKRLVPVQLLVFSL
jgi:hypothetical protein